MGSVSYKAIKTIQSLSGKQDRDDPAPVQPQGTDYAEGGIGQELRADSNSPWFRFGQAQGYANRKLREWYAGFITRFNKGNNRAEQNRVQRQAQV
jgi:hypothetical protein